MIVLGLDSAARTGYAVVERLNGSERLLERGVLDLRDQETLATRIDDFAHKMAGRFEIDVVAIEDNYLDTNEDKANVVTLKSLARMVGRWCQAFESRGITTVLANPQKWAVGVLRGVLMGPTSDRKTRKKACGIWVRATFKVQPEENEADAIGIATYEARQRDFFERAAGAAV